MKRFAPALLAFAFALASGFAARAWAAPPVTADELRASMLASDSIVVIHVAVDWVTVKDSAGADKAVSSTRRAAIRPVKRPWMQRFAALLLPAGVRLTPELCPIPRASSATPKPWLASVLWVNKDGRGQVYANFDDRCGNGGLADRAPAGFSIEGRQDSLLALVREVLASDTSMHAPRTPPAPPRAPAAATDSSGMPLFGSYVFVEVVPELVTKVPPIYPADAREAGVNGIVGLEALVDPGGHVRDTRISRSIPMLDAAAVAAVRQWVFKPATARGKPVASWVHVPVTFKLDTK